MGEGPPEEPYNRATYTFTSLLAGAGMSLGDGSIGIALSAREIFLISGYLSFDMVSGESVRLG
jgi:hypothetical protein